LEALAALDTGKLRFVPMGIGVEDLIPMIEELERLGNEWFYD